MPTVNYLWNPLNDNVVAEYDDSGATIAEYTTEPEQFGNVVSQRRNGQDSYYHYDGVGSTLAVTDSTGAVTDTRSYTAFGETTEQTGSTVIPYQYIGRKGYYRDGYGEEYMVRQRPLSAPRARWLAVDPLQYFKELNGHSYVGNRPVSNTDPSGLIFGFDCCPCRCTSLRIVRLGWKIFYAHRFITSIKALSYAWVARAETFGTPECWLNTNAIGTLTETYDGIRNNVNPFPGSAYRAYVSDGWCQLPDRVTGSRSDISCRGVYDFTKCRGGICYIDAPGGIWWSSRALIFGRAAPKLSFCVALDVTFHVQCHGGLVRDYSLLTTAFRIKERACIYFDKSGAVTKLRTNNGITDRVTAFESSPTDVAEEACLDI